MKPRNTAALGFAGACIASASVLDVVRLALAAIGLRKLRAAHPELFVAEKALVAIELTCHEYDKEFPPCPQLP